MCRKKGERGSGSGEGGEGDVRKKWRKSKVEMRERRRGGYVRRG